MSEQMKTSQEIRDKAKLYRDMHKEEHKQWYKKYKEENKEKIRIRNFNHRNDYRRRAIANICDGIIRCVKCGFDDFRALQIDHINGGGIREREGISEKAYYRYIFSLPTNEAKKKYQILCANCNWIKRHENRESHGRGQRV